jgi:arsenate reductase (thioredoxin)
MPGRIKVLFLCTRNSCRSQMAEAILRRIAGDRFDVFSAGLDPSDIDDRTRSVMAEIGLDLEGQYSKSVEEYLGRMHFGYLITVCDSADQSCPAVFPGMGTRLHWSFEDPAAVHGTSEEEMTAFREVRDQIAATIADWIVSVP